MTRSTSLPRPFAACGAAAALLACLATTADAQFVFPTNGPAGARGVQYFFADSEYNMQGSPIAYLDLSSADPSTTPTSVAFSKSIGGDPLVDPIAGAWAQGFISQIVEGDGDLLEILNAGWDARIFGTVDYAFDGTSTVSSGRLEFTGSRDMAHTHQVVSDPGPNPDQVEQRTIQDTFRDGNPNRGILASCPFELQAPTNSLTIQDFQITRSESIAGQLGRTDLIWTLYTDVNGNDQVDGPDTIFATRNLWVVGTGSAAGSLGTFFVPGGKYVLQVEYDSDSMLESTATIFGGGSAFLLQALVSDQVSFVMTTP